MDDTRARLAALSGDKLELSLFDLASHIVWPPAPDLTPVPIAHLPQRRSHFERRRLWLAAAVVIAAIGVALVLSQGLRDSVAGFLGVRGIEIDVLRGDEPVSPT